MVRAVPCRSRAPHTVPEVERQDTLCWEMKHSVLMVGNKQVLQLLAVLETLCMFQRGLLKVKQSPVEGEASLCLGQMLFILLHNKNEGISFIKNK